MICGFHLTVNTALYAVRIIVILHTEGHKHTYRLCAVEGSPNVWLPSYRSYNNVPVRNIVNYMHCIVAIVLIPSR